MFALFVLAGFIWLHPASAVLLRGDATTAIGDGSEPAADAVPAPPADDAGEPAPDPAAAVDAGGDADGAEPAGD